MGAYDLFHHTSPLRFFRSNSLDFYTEMVRRFIGVCTGWPTGHVIIEDRAIIGGKTNESAPVRLDDELSVIQAVIISPLQEMLGHQIQFVGRFSTKDVILNEQYPDSARGFVLWFKRCKAIGRKFSLPFVHIAALQLPDDRVMTDKINVIRNRGCTAEHMACANCNMNWISLQFK